MRLGIMQPYWFPYIGYFQLMNAVDTFVVYDNIQFTKKGWINRNRILADGKDRYLTVPLKNDSDFLDIKDRYLAGTWITERSKMLNKIKASYCKATHFYEVFPMLEKAILFEEDNLFNFILHTLRLVKEYLGIQASLVISSAINMDHGLKNESRVIEICKALRADEYINPAGGTALYNKHNFKNAGIGLFFLKTGDVQYLQFRENEFIPFLSIIDVMMFNEKDVINKFLNSYSLIN